MYSIGFLAYFGAVWPPIRPVAEVNKQERGLEPTETEVNIQEWGRVLVHQTLVVNRSSILWRHVKLSSTVWTQP